MQMTRQAKSKGRTNKQSLEKRHHRRHAYHKRSVQERVANGETVVQKVLKGGPGQSAFVRTQQTHWSEILEYRWGIPLPSGGGFTLPIGGREGGGREGDCKRGGELTLWIHGAAQDLISRRFPLYIYTLSVSL